MNNTLKNNIGSIFNSQNKKMQNLKRNEINAKNVSDNVQLNLNNNKSKYNSTRNIMDSLNILMERTKNLLNSYNNLSTQISKNIKEKNNKNI